MFQTGDAKKAAALMKRIIRADASRNPYFPKQLKRFESGKVETPIPDEDTGED